MAGNSAHVENARIMTQVRKTRPLVVGWVAICLSGIVGCYESKQEVSLNPDGSGKVELEILFTSAIPSMNGGIPALGEKPGRDTIGELIGHSKGIDVWKNVEYQLNEDGTSTLTGVAYFKDISSVALGKFNTTRILWEKQDSNTGVLSIESPSSQPDGAQASGTLEVSAEERKQRIEKERKGWRRSRPFLAAVFSLFKSETTIHVPGSLGSVSGLTNSAPGTVHLTLDSDAAMAALDAVMADDEKFAAYMDTKAAVGGDGTSDLYGLVYEQRGPFRAVVTNITGPGFDYDREVREARAAYPELLSQLAARDIMPRPPPAGAALKGVAVTGLRMVSEWDAPRTSRPFNTDPGCTVCLVAALTGAAERVDSVVVHTATGDDGRSLRRSAKALSTASRRLIRNGTAVMMTLELALPGPDVRTIRELSGTVRYTTKGINRRVDLGIAELTAGTKGTLYDAEISSIGRSIWKGGSGQKLTLRMRPPPRPIVSIAVHDGAGGRLDCLQEKHQANRGALRYEFRLSGSFPREGGISVELAEPEQTHDAPFRLTDIPLSPAFTKR